LGRHPLLQHRQGLLAQVELRLGKGGLPRGQAEQIGRDQHLAIAAGAGTDADHRNHQLLLEPGCQLGGHMLDHQGKAAGLLQRLGLLQHPLLGHRIGGLAAVAELMHRLWGQPQMPHHRNAAAHQPIDHHQRLGFSALELDRRGR